ncbi:MAG: hypothetical protein JSS50_05140 [Proteobacteria bacterium]|nr:hypothetical protein [Pseudomonadota bacterium]
MLAQNKQTLEAIWNRYDASKVGIALGGLEYQISNNTQGQTISEVVGTNIPQSVDIKMTSNLSIFFNYSTKRGDQKKQTVMESDSLSANVVKMIAEYILTTKSIIELSISNIEKWDYKSLCILLYLKMTRPELKLQVSSDKEILGSGIAIFDFFNPKMDFAKKLDEVEIPTEIQHNWKMQNMGDAHTQDYTRPQNNPLYTPKAACIITTALGLAIMSIGIGMALGNAEAAFTNLGGVNLYQALALGGSIMAFLPTATWLMYERREKSAERTLFSPFAFLDNFSPVLNYGTGIFTALYGAMGMLGGYSPVTKHAAQGIKVALSEMMRETGMSAAWITIAMPLILGMVLDKQNRNPIDKPFIAYTLVAGLSATTISTITPYLMEQTSLFADPAAISVSFFVSLAVVPVLGLLAREATRALQ